MRPHAYLHCQQAHPTHEPHHHPTQTRLRCTSVFNCPRAHRPVYYVANRDANGLGRNNWALWQCTAIPVFSCCLCNRDVQACALCALVATCGRGPPPPVAALSPSSPPVYLRALTVPACRPLALAAQQNRPECLPLLHNFLPSSPAEAVQVGPADRLRAWQLGFFLQLWMLSLVLLDVFQRIRGRGKFRHGRALQF